MRASLRSLAGVLIAGVLLVLVVWSMPEMPLAPCGIVLPEEGAKPQTSGPIKLYDQASAPVDAATVGTVTMMYHTASQGPESQESLFNAVSELVKNQGGNAVVLNQFFFIPPEAASGPALYFKGKVLRLQNNS